jgi:cobalamin biosynthesis Mg chelatase CobN
MEIRLQQALVAAREGHFETAQLLLAEAIRQNPEDANVWFLLAHLVDSPERQALYLENALLLEPEHMMAKEHLARLYSADVPPPIIKGGGELVSEPSQATPAPTFDSKFVPLSPARVNASPPVVEPPTPAPSAPSYSQAAPETSSKAVDADWTKVAGSPKRANTTATGGVTRPRTATPPVRQQAVAAAPQNRAKQQPVNKWLLAALIILVAVAAFVVSYLAYSIFFQ